MHHSTTKVTEFSAEEIDSGYLSRLMGGKLGIYVWSLRPTISNIERITPLLSMSTFSRRIDGADAISRVKLKVSVDRADSHIPTSDKYSLDNLMGHPYCLTAFSEISSLLSPPFYIGMSDRLPKRMEEHKNDIRRALDGAESERTEGHFGWALKEYSDDLLSCQVITAALKMSDLNVRVYVFDDTKITVDQVGLIENALITIYSPLGNKKYIK